MKQGTLYQTLSAALIAGGLVLASSASAAGYCSGAAATEGIAVGDITFGGNSANDCYGVVSGNISGSSGASILNTLNWGTGWTYLDATDASSATFMGLQFAITATDGFAGNWTLTGVDTNGTALLNFPASFDLAVGMKAGNEYALWEFDNVVVDGFDSGTFKIAFTNNGGNHPALSHLVVFGRESGGGPGTALISAVPETDTYAMMLAGLGLIGFVARRKLG